HEIRMLVKRIGICPLRNLYLDRIIFPFWCVWRVLQLRRQVSIGCVYTAQGQLPHLAGWMLQKFGFPWVVDIWDDLTKDINEMRFGKCHFSFVKYIYFTTVNAICCLILQQADALVCALEPSILKRYKINPKRVLAITNGVDETGLYTVRITKRGEIQTIAYIGDCAILRGVRTLLGAVTLVSKSVPSVKLVLAGPNHDWLVKEVNRLGLNEIVEIKGLVTHSEALAVIASSSVAVCPLRPIGDYPYTYPLKIFEYMSLGKAIVASDLPGISRVIKSEETGLLVPPESIEDWAKAILRLLNDEKLRRRLEETARRESTKFYWQEVQKPIWQLLEKKWLNKEEMYSG
ncbi:MAG TPA: hypothetical protein DHV62_05895, partial [Elusimicrobia bacterium]|nr:hypothetical protein [Elusimicrobiota bacterium]